MVGGCLVLRALSVFLPRHELLSIFPSHEFNADFFGRMIIVTDIKKAKQIPNSLEWNISGLQMKC